MRRLLSVWLCVNTPSVLDKSRLTRSSKGKMHMKSNTLVRSMALAAALALTVPVFAKPVAKSLAVPHAVKFGKVDVKAGD